MERITGPALKLPRGTVYSFQISGRRHRDVIHAMRLLQESIEDIADSVQGFMTNTQRFVNRYKAVDIARASNQILDDVRRPKLCPDQLYSEDLW